MFCEAKQKPEIKTASQIRQESWLANEIRNLKQKTFANCKNKTDANEFALLDSKIFANYPNKTTANDFAQY